MRNLSFSQWRSWRFKLSGMARHVHCKNSHQSTRREYFPAFTLCVQRRNGREAQHLPKFPPREEKETSHTDAGAAAEPPPPPRPKLPSQLRRYCQRQIWNVDMRWSNVTMSDAIQVALSGSEHLSQMHQTLLRATHSSQLQRAILPHMQRSYPPSLNTSTWPERSQWPRSLRRGPAAARLLRLPVRIPGGGGMDVCLLWVLCCQVEVSASDCSLVQRTPTECGVSVIVKPLLSIFSLRRADPSSRGVLPTVMIVKRRQWGSGSLRAVAPYNKSEEQVMKFLFN
jgi:hypothetical protein